MMQIKLVKRLIINIKINANIKIHQLLKLFIINEKRPIIIEPNTKNKSRESIVSFINAVGVICKKLYFLSKLRVRNNLNGKVRIKFIKMKVFTKIIAFK